MAQRDLNVILGLDTENFLKGVKRTERTLKRFSRQMQNIGRDMTQMITLPLGLAAGGAIKAAADFEQLETSLSVLTGSAEEGARVFKDLQQFSASTPFQLPDIAKAAKQLLAFGFNVDQVKSSLQVIGDVAAGSGNQIGELSQIFGQVAAAGKLTGERFNQLSERAVPIGRAIADSMGIAESEVKDFVSKGLVSFDDFEKAFRSLAAEGGLFAGGMEKQSQTLAGVFSTFRDNIALAMGEIGTSIVEVFNLKEAMKQITVAIQGAAKWFEGLDNRTKKIILTVGAAAAAMGPLLIVLGKAASVATVFTSGLSVLTGGVKMLAGALSGLALNPVVLGIAAVAAGLVLAWRHSEAFREAVRGAMRAAAVAVDYLKERFGIFIGTVKNLGGIFLDMARIVLRSAKAAFGGIAKIAGPVLKAVGERFAGLGDIIKGFFKFSLMAAAGFVRGMATAFNELITIIREGVGAFIDAFEAVKAGDISGAIEAFKEGLKKGNPIGVALTQGGRLADSFKSGFAKGVTDTEQLFKDMKAAYQGGINETVADIEVPSIDITSPSAQPAAQPSGGGATTTNDTATRSKSAMLQYIDTTKEAVKVTGDFGATVTAFGQTLPPVWALVGQPIDQINNQLADIDLRAQAFGRTAGETLPEKLSLLQEALYQALSEGGAPEYIETLKNQISDFGNEIDSLAEKSSTFSEVFGEAMEGMNAGMELVKKNVEEGKGAFDGLGAAALAEAAKVIKSYIQTAVAAQIAKLLQFLPPPFNLAAAAAGGALVGSVFQRLISSIGIPALAEGGIVTKPTLALIGEAGPEAVVPLNNQNIGASTINIAGEFILRGADLLLAVERAERQQSRVR